MLGTGNVPVGDKVGAMPSAPQGGMFPHIRAEPQISKTNNCIVKGKAPAVEEDEEEEELRKLQAEMAL
jgi:charged multivesicular body protein 4A/B